MLSLFYTTLYAAAAAETVAAETPAIREAISFIPDHTDVAAGTVVWWQDPKTKKNVFSVKGDPQKRVWIPRNSIESGIDAAIVTFILKNPEEQSVQTTDDFVAETFLATASSNDDFVFLVKPSRTAAPIVKGQHIEHRFYSYLENPNRLYLYVRGKCFGSFQYNEQYGDFALLDGRPTIRLWHNTSAQAENYAEQAENYAEQAENYADLVLSILSGNSTVEGLTLYIVGERPRTADAGYYLTVVQNWLSQRVDPIIIATPGWAIDLAAGSQNPIAQYTAKTIRTRKAFVDFDELLNILSTGASPAEQSFATALMIATGKGAPPRQTLAQFEGVRSIPHAHLSPLVVEETVACDASIDTSVKQQCLEGCRAAYDEQRKLRQSGAAAAAPSPWHPIQGRDKADCGAVYQYDNTNHILYIAFRGSLKIKDKSHMHDPDWEKNFTCVLNDPALYGLQGFEGKLHTGFMQRYREIQAHLYKALEKITFAHNTRVIVTGHSLGAAVAQVAATDIALNVLPKIYSGFNNAETNSLWLIPIAAPRVADQVAATAIHKVLGRHNILRVNVLGDPVTLAALSRAQTTDLKEQGGRFLLSHSIAQLLEHCTGYEALGYLALQPATHAVTSNTSAIVSQVAAALWACDWRKAIAALLQQAAAPLHNGGLLENGETHFEPRQLMSVSWTNLLTSSAHKDEYTELKLKLQEGVSTARAAARLQ